MQKNFKIIISLLCSWIVICTVSPFVYAEKPDIVSENALVIDADSGFVYYAKNETETVHPSVAVKTMTVLVALNEIENLDEKVTLSDNIYDGVSLISSAKLKAGENLTVKDLIACVLVVSSNEASVALSEYICPGDRQAFVDKMNKLAKEYGALGTYFTTCTGEETSGSYSTTADIAKICIQAAKNEDYISLSSKPYYVVSATNKSEKRVLYSTNMFATSLSKYYMSGVLPIKNHYTSVSNYSMASIYSKKSTNIVCVVINSKNEKVDGVTKNYSYLDTRELITWSKSAYKSYTLVASKEMVCQVDVKLGKKHDAVVLSARDELVCMLEVDFDENKLTKKIDVPSSVKAPVEKGDVIGKVAFEYDGEYLGEVELIAQSGIELDMMLYYKELINSFFKNPFVICACVVIVILFVGYIILTINYNRKKKRKKSNYKRIRY